VEVAAGGRNRHSYRWKMASALLFRQKKGTAWEHHGLTLLKAMNMAVAWRAWKQAAGVSTADRKMEEEWRAMKEKEGRRGDMARREKKERLLPHIPTPSALTAPHHI